MHPSDQTFVRIDTTRPDLWQAGPQAGIDVLPLHRFGDEETFLLRIAPKASLPTRSVPGGEELFVLEGGCEIDGGDHGEWTWRRHPIGQAPTVTSGDGCVLYVKRGHLKNPPPAPAR